jgi:hypothetical protein
MRQSGCRTALWQQSVRIGHVTTVHVLHPAKSRSGFGSRGATLAMLANLHPCQNDDGRLCLRDTDQVKTQPRGRHGAGVSEPGPDFGADYFIPHPGTLLLTGVRGAVNPRHIVSHEITRYVTGLLQSGFARPASCSEANEVRS